MRFMNTLLSFFKRFLISAANQNREISKNCTVLVSLKIKRGFIAHASLGIEAQWVESIKDLQSWPKLALGLQNSLCKKRL